MKMKDHVKCLKGVKHVAKRKKGKLEIISCQRGTFLESFLGKGIQGREKPVERGLTSMPSREGKEWRGGEEGGDHEDCQIWEGSPNRDSCIYLGQEGQRAWLWVCKAQGDRRR